MDLIEGVNSRVCTKCGELKSFEEFYKSKKGKYGIESKCKECINEKNKQYYENNKEDIVEKGKQYYENNKEYKAEYDKKYRENNKEHIVKYRKEYYENNKDFIDERNKKYRENNKEYFAEYRKEYYENNKEYYFESVRKRRALKSKAKGDFTELEFKETLEIFDYRCAYTGEPILEDLSNCHREHIVPLSKGGDNGIWNIVPSLDWVNLSKNNSDMEEWYRQQPYFSEERLNKIYEYMSIMEERYLEYDNSEEIA